MLAGALITLVVLPGCGCPESARLVQAVNLAEGFQETYTRKLGHPLPDGANIRICRMSPISDYLIQRRTRHRQRLDAARHLRVFLQRWGVVRLDAGVDHQ